MPVAIAQGDLLYQDTFAYPDGDLSGRGDWTADFWTGEPTLRVLSGQAAGPTSGAWCSNKTAATWSVASVGRDFIARGITPGAQYTWVYTYFLGVAGLTPNAYWMRWSLNAGFYIAAGKVKGGTFTTLIATATMAQVGDDLAVRVMPGGVLSLYRKPSGGVWGQLSGPATDTATPYTSGCLALAAYDAAVRWDGVEVRSVEATGTTYLKSGRPLRSSIARASRVAGRGGTTWAKAGKPVVGDH